MTRLQWTSAAVVALLASTASAQTTAEARQRCATRLSAVLLGKPATAALLSSADPQGTVDNMLTNADFVEKFSRWVNAQFNVDPGETAPEDASYYMSKYVLQNNRPWRDMFVGAYRVDADATAGAIVVADTNGLGYFRSPAWMRRYAGNELAGYRIAAGYRMMNNVLGLKLVAAVNTEGVDATGRRQAACAGCHYNNVYGLDFVAKVLSKRVGAGATMTFSAPNEGAQVLFGGISVTDDKSLVQAMVGSLDFRFRACRMATEFLYGRTEHKCEGPVFDRCMNAFATSGTIQSAVSAIAKDPSFCQ